MNDRWIGEDDLFVGRGDSAIIIVRTGRPPSAGGRPGYLILGRANGEPLPVAGRSEEGVVRLVEVRATR